MAWARSWISASFSGGGGADGMGGLRFRCRVSLSRRHLRSSVQRFHHLSGGPPEGTAVAGFPFCVSAESCENCPSPAPDDTSPVSPREPDMPVNHPSPLYRTRRPAFLACGVAARAWALVADARGAGAGDGSAAASSPGSLEARLMPLIK